MRVKPEIKISVSILLAAIIIAAGIVMFQKLIHNKQVFETNLYTHVPASVTGILQINKEKNLKTFTTYFPELQNVLLTTGSSLTYPVLIAEQKKDIYIICKVTEEQESTIKSLLATTLFSSFAPKVRAYKNANILFYPADNNRFFSCIFYQGFFVGGYNYTLLENFIDTNSSNNIFSNKQAKEIRQKITTGYPANMYFNNEIFFTSFNINLEKNRIEMEGFTNNTVSDNWSREVTADSDSIAIDYSIFPDSLLSYTINSHATGVSGSLICLFDTPSYSFVLNNNPISTVYALKHRQDRFDLYSQLNKLEINYIQRKFSTRDVVLGDQHIYKTSEQMGREIFHHNSPVYLTFYKNYLLISADREVLIQYLKANGNYKPTLPLDPVSISTQTISLFFSNDIQKFPSQYLSNYYLIDRITAKGQAYTKTYMENGEKKIDISLNN